MCSSPGVKEPALMEQLEILQYMHEVLMQRR